MMNEIWLGMTVFLATICVYGLFELVKNIKNKKKDMLWDLASLAFLIILTSVTYYAYLKLNPDSLANNTIYLSIIYLLTAVLVIFVFRISYHVYNDIYEKREKLIKMNFILDSDSQQKAEMYENKADLLSDLNKTLEMQTEILQEKEAELKKANDDLNKAQEELKEEKASVDKKVIERTKELRTQKEIVEGLLKQKNDFINQLSHDLRTPLTPLLNLLPMLKNNLKSKDDLHLTEICIKNTKYLEKLVLSTLKLSRLGTKNIELDLSDVNFNKLLKDILATGNHFEEQIEVINKIDPKISLKVDELKIRELFENIITNAIKYNDKKNKKIIITSKIDKKFIQFEFKDNGIGLESKDLNSIFDEFYKVDPSRHQHNSSGLGLSIARRIIAMHDGEIAALSDGLGKGSTILIALPVNKKKK